jgi:hypothetical protein
LRKNFHIWIAALGGLLVAAGFIMTHLASPSGMTDYTQLLWVASFLAIHGALFVGVGVAVWMLRQG